MQIQQSNLQVKVKLDQFSQQQNQPTQRNQLLEKQQIIPSNKIQKKIQSIFPDFQFRSITLTIVIINCLMWLSVNLIYYWGGIDNWNCVEYKFFAKYQPSITYHYEIWRLILSSFMFRSWLQFYFNNFALNIVGYVTEKQSKIKFITVFYCGIITGHMLSCCFNQPNQLTVGTSCGTIALLPIQIKRFISLRRINPSSAKAGFKFLAFCIVSNFILNVLAIFKIGAVDWISHLGCLVTGFVFLVYFWINEKHENHPSDIKTQHFAVKYLKYCPIIILSIFCTLMGVIIWVYLPYRKIGQAELQQINFLCNKNI